MKKIFGALMIAVCIGMAMPAQAQLHFGVKGGLNLSKASFSDVKENFKKDNFTGFFIGPWRKFLERRHAAETKEPINIALVGKYDLQDAYKSIREALSQASFLQEWQFLYQISLSG